MTEEEMKKQILETLNELEDLLSKKPLPITVAALLAILQCLLQSNGMSFDSSYHFVNDFGEKYAKTLSALVLRDDVLKEKENEV